MINFVHPNHIQPINSIVNPVYIQATVAGSQYPSTTISINQMNKGSQIIPQYKQININGRNIVQPINYLNHNLNHNLNNNISHNINHNVNHNIISPY